MNEENEDDCRENGAIECQFDEKNCVSQSEHGYYDWRLFEAKK